jgi:hypothetical protein
VLRYQFDPDAVEARSDGYYVTPDLPDTVSLEVRVFNLSREPRDLRLSGQLESSRSEGDAVIVPLEARPARVPAEAAVDVKWQADLTGAFGAADRVVASFEASAGGPEPLDVLHLDFLRKKKDSPE